MKIDTSHSHGGADALVGRDERETCRRPARASAPLARGGFSLVEVLLAIFILGIGMIMVASVFPVGANWTRQTTEDSVGQVIAQSAESVIRTHYGPGGDLRDFFAPNFYDPTLAPLFPANANPLNRNSVLQSPFAPSPFVLQALPGFLNIPANERSYQFIKSKANSAIQPAFPAPNPSQCTYFWTALIRLNPAHMAVAGPGTSNVNGIQPAPSYKYDLYILVFRKGWAEQGFPTMALTAAPLQGEIPNTRNLANGEFYIPSVLYYPYNAGSHDPSSTPSVFGAVPAMGQYGIGVYSGTVFRQVIDPSPTMNLSIAGPGGAFPRPMIALSGGNPEPIIASPPGDGSNASPLIYIYQTTISF